MSGSDVQDLNSNFTPPYFLADQLCRGNLAVYPDLLELLDIIFLTTVAVIVTSLVLCLLALAGRQWERRRAQEIQARPPLLGYHYRRVFQHGAESAAFVLHLPHQQKPVILDVVKVLVEILLLCMAFGVVTAKAALVIWSVYDQLAFVYVVCLWVAGRRRLDDQRTGALTLLIYAIYCLIFGVPFGCIFKIISIDRDFPGTDHISPLYAELITVPVVLVLYLLRRRGCRGRSVLWILATLMFCAAQVMAFVSVVVCRHYLCAEPRETPACPALLYSWMVAFTPLALEIAAAGLCLMVYTYKRGELMRYVPEIASLISWPLLLVTYFYVVDRKEDIWKYSQIVWVLPSIMATIGSDLFTVKQLYGVQKLALRHRGGMGNIAESLAEQGANTVTRSVDISAFNRDSTLRESLANRLKMRDHDSACPICFEEFRPDASIVVGVIKSCGHYFHLQCLVQWLDAQSSCPVCRGDAPLDLDAIKAISYTDLRTVVGIRSLQPRTLDIGDETLLRKLKESRAKSYAVSSHTNPAYEDDEQGQGAITPNTNPSSRNTPTGTLERSRQRCSICHERYEDNPQFMVVGYMPRCAHYFHFRCIWNYVMSHNHCPTCNEQNPDVTNNTQPEVNEAEPAEPDGEPGPPSASETEPVRGDLEIVMALLSDVS